MRSNVLIAFLLGAILTASALARAADIDKDLKKAEKVALSPADILQDKSKGLCVCLEHSNSSFVDAIGKLRVEKSGTQFNDVLRVFCMVLLYDKNTGARSSQTECDGAWAPFVR